jgi:hypothetical protein
MENQNTENTVIPATEQPVTVELVQIPKEQLNQLVDRLKEYEHDILALVNVLGSVTGLFSGKSTNIMSLIPVITKILNDPSKLDMFKEIGPILDKYTQK